jgi:AmmeMemoRadiSam system protein B
MHGKGYNGEVLQNARIFFAAVLLVGLASAGVYILQKKPSSPTPNFHTSMYYFDNSDFFAASLKPYVQTAPLTPRPRVFITNQHVLAASLIARQFALARDESVQRVVLITQNNWEAGTAPIITSLQDWKTPLGTVPTDTAFTQMLVGKKLASVEENTFIHEHGITGVIPYVAYAFPNADVVVLVVRDKTPAALLDAMAGELEAQMDKNTVVVGTIDMSHYLPKYLADVHDQKTIDAITHFQYDILPRLDIDTAPTLRIVMKIAEHRGEKTFTTVDHANSADITAQPDLLSTTSYITGYFSRGALVSSAGPLSVLFTGDVMLDRTVALHAKANGDAALFSQVERMFLGTDATVANLEGTITTEPSVSIPDHTILRFTFDPHVAPFLKNLGVTAVSLSNNHTFDFGSAGFKATKQYLQQAEILSFGSPHNDDELSTSFTVRGTKVCLVGYEEFVQPNPAPVAQHIAQIRPGCGLLIATMHAGVEYNAGFTSHQQEVAHAFVDAGADAVIGTHPHIVEPLEIYKGKAIFYSLGNFMFDQNFSFATTHGLAVQMTWAGSEMRYTLVPVTMKDEEVSFSSPADSIKTLRALVDSNLSKSVASDILSTYSFTLK